MLNKAKLRTYGAEVKTGLGCMLVMMGDSFLSLVTVGGCRLRNNWKRPPKNDVIIH